MSEFHVFLITLVFAGIVGAIIGDDPALMHRPKERRGKRILGAAMGVFIVTAIYGLLGLLLWAWSL